MVKINVCIDKTIAFILKYKILHIEKKYFSCQLKSPGRILYLFSCFEMFLLLINFFIVN